MAPARTVHLWNRPRTLEANSVYLLIHSGPGRNHKYEMHVRKIFQFETAT